MDFFQSQDQARNKSRLLVVYFLLAMTAIIVALYAVISVIFYYAAREAPGAVPAFTLWDPLRFGGVFLVTVALIGLATLFKINQLRQGGSVVAKSVGGRKVHADTRDFKEQQLLNVVEEMAIASGTPMPEVFILDDETGINAFAAGFSPNDAAVAVTRGTLDTLSRDELQGVIAHEFSHILNGDMRLNIKLAGILFGILILAMSGRVMLHSMRFAAFRGRGSRGGRGGGGGIIVAIMLTALALLVIGYIGVFFGRLIQAAVSRQREYLADASAVQFTRNPDGISGALRKIGGLARHSTLGNGKAMNVAHMCFGNIEKRQPLFFSLATHPPLEKRIRAIDPQFDGKFPRVSPAETDAKTSLPQDRSMAGSDAPRETAGKTDRTGGGERFPMSGAAVIAAVGVMEAGQVEAAKRQIALIPQKIREARKDSAAARAVILSLVFDRDPNSLMKQMGTVEGEAAPEVAKAIHSVSLEARKLPPELRLPVLEIMIPVLYDLPVEDYERFSRVLDQCTKSDQKVDFSEFIIQRLIRRQVEPRIYPKSVDRATIRYNTLKPLRESIEILISFIVSHGAEGDQEKAALFRKAREYFPEPDSLSMRSASEITMEDLGGALDQLIHAGFEIRRKILEVSGLLVHEDGRISVEEAEWIRLLSLSLDCPMAPLTPSEGKSQSGD